MSVPEPLNPRKPNARRLAGKFTPNTPFHHPHLDPKLDPEDLHLVPPALFHGKLNRELPQPAVTNLHVVLKLTDDPNELLEDFHDKIPQIDEVLRQWGEKGASPTTTTPGRADITHLADAVDDSAEHATCSNIPSNLRTTDWSDFDGSYVHLEDVKPIMAALPTEQSSDLREHSMRRNSTPSNMRVTEWLADKQYDEAYTPEPGTPRQSGPYETFWKKHDPYGPRLALDTDEGETTGSTSQ